MAETVSDFLQHFTMRYPHAKDGQWKGEIRNFPTILCHRCSSISLRHGSTTPHYSSFSELETSAKKGCTLCDTFGAKGAEKHCMENGNIKFGISVFKMPSPEYELSLRLLVASLPEAVSSPSIGPQTWIECRVHLCSADKSHNASTVFQPSVDVGLPLHSPAPTMYGSSRDALRQARVWLDTCMLSHPECHEPCVDYVPTRLVSTTEGAIRLCLGKSIAHVKRYATLNHCWGKATFATLMRDDIEISRIGIPETALSQTIRDAIQIPSDLEIQYIWIDTWYVRQSSPLRYEVRLLCTLKEV